tara:strand:- start:460 stop:621 length:162 start_codon:yes stop_codon:yes gene_type:complete
MSNKNQNNNEELSIRLKKNIKLRKKQIKLREKEKIHGRRTSQIGISNLIKHDS